MGIKLYRKCLLTLRGSQVLLRKPCDSYSVTFERRRGWEDWQGRHTTVAKHASGARRPSAVGVRMEAQRAAPPAAAGGVVYDSLTRRGTHQHRLGYERIRG